MTRSPTDLPDINVWVALSDASHVHHRRATHYWDVERESRTAFSGVTRMGMVRILTLSQAMAGNPFTPEEALDKYREFANLPELDFIADSEGLDLRVQMWTRMPFFTGKLLTDAWIASLALENGCRVVSFDSDFAKFPGLRFLHLEP